MRNWINLTETFAKQAEDILSEDLDIEKIEKNKIVLDDPENDEVEALEKDSPEKKKDVLKDVSKAMHEALADLGAAIIAEDEALDEADESGSTSRYTIGSGENHDYTIVDSHDGSVVADKIWSGHEAHNVLRWWNSKKA